MEDYQVKQSRILAALEDQRNISKSWMKMYQKLQADLDVKTRKTIDQQRQQKLYEQDLLSKSKSFNLLKQKMEIENQNLKEEEHKQIQQNTDLLDRITELCKRNQKLEAEQNDLVQTYQSLQSKVKE